MASKPKLAVFKFASCDGCQLSLLDCEDQLLAIADAVEIAYFLEARSQVLAGPYDVGLVEGSITTDQDAERLKKIRDQAKILIAMGACACLGGVHNLRTRFPLAEAMEDVYGTHTVDSGPVRKLSDVVDVDIELPGCPISKPEFEWLVQQLILGLEPQFPQYSVCMECKQRINTCVFDMGMICFGPVTRAGCNAICLRNHLGCMGCRGPSEEANYESLMEILKERGFSDAEIAERAQFFNAFSSVDAFPVLGED